MRFEFEHEAWRVCNLVKMQTRLLTKFVTGHPQNNAVF